MEWVAVFYVCLAVDPVCDWNNGDRFTFSQKYASFDACDGDRFHQQVMMPDFLHNQRPRKFNYTLVCELAAEM